MSSSTISGAQRPSTSCPPYSRTAPTSAADSPGSRSVPCPAYQITLPSAWLPRAVRLEIVGSGHGSVSTQDIISELPALAAEILCNRYLRDADTVSTPLSQVQATWNAPIARGQRIVFVP